MPDADAYAALRNPIVRRFAFGRFGAVLGLQMLSVSVGWHLYERTASAWALGLVGAVEILPVFLLMPVTGTVADRFPRRRVAALAHAGIGVATLGLAAARRRARVGLIYALLAVIGTARAFAMPAAATILPRLLTPSEFANANAWISSTFQLAAVTGPALAGVLIALTGGATAALAVAAAGNCSSCRSCCACPKCPLPATARGRLAGRASTGSGSCAAAGVPGGDHAGPLRGPPRRRHGAPADLREGHPAGGPAGLGWLRAAPAVGATLTALLQTRLPPWCHPGRVLLAAVAGYGVATVGLGLSRHFVLSLACLFATGVCDSISVVIRLTLEQVITPDELRGRVSAIKSVFVGFSNEFGAFESGATAALFGPVASVVGGGIGVIAVVAR